MSADAIVPVEPALLHWPLRKRRTVAMSAKVPLLSLVTMIAIGYGNVAIAQNEPAGNNINPDLVRQKIAALAELDETVSREVRADSWLAARRDKIVPALIAALDDQNPAIAEKALKILRDVTPNQQLTDALITKASDPKSPLRLGALRQLEKSAEDPRIVRLLDAASTQAAAFPDPLVRAKWSLLAGRRDRAVEILKPLLKPTNRYYDSEAIAGVKMLGEIGGPATIALLKTIAADNCWYLAAEAHQALAKVDPENNGLTRDQATFLQRSGGGKESREGYQQRMRELASLNVEELRPYVLQMLRDETSGRRAALNILAVWKDKQSLPQIREMLQIERSNCREEAVAAFLATDDSPQAQEAVLKLLKDNTDGRPIQHFSPVSFDAEPIVKGIVIAPISVERKVTILRAAQARLNLPEAVPQGISYHWNQGHDLRELLVALIDRESNVLTLARYCNVIERDQEQRFAPQVRRAMTILMSDAAIVANAERPNGHKPEAASMILHAVGTYHLKELAPDVLKLMNSRDPTIRKAAQATGAKLQIAGALDGLYAQLADENASHRKSAVDSLLDVKPVDEADRMAREELILSHLGKPSEIDVLRVLVTCPGPRSVAALRIMLDDADARRGLYAAWVLAQFPDKQAATTAIRRLAIVCLFHHELYQQGAGIDFTITPDVRFHQQIFGHGRTDEFRVNVPKELLQTFLMDELEQQFAVRYYRLADHITEPHVVNSRFLDRNFHTVMPMNESHLPLLKEIAAHDTYLEKLMVKGKLVAHFRYRQLAAQAIADIEKKPASYVALSGEVIDSKAFPQPYEDQDRLLAKFLLDRLQKVPPANEPKNGEDWEWHNFLQDWVKSLVFNFGPKVSNAIRAEATERNVSVKYILRP